MEAYICYINIIIETSLQGGEHEEDYQGEKQREPLVPSSVLSSSENR